MKHLNDNFILGIDAYNIRAGGGITHLSEILLHCKPSEYGFSKVVLWAPITTLNQIEDKFWLTKLHTPLLNSSIIKRYYWKLFLSNKEYKKNNIDILFIPGGSYIGSFRPFITINQNLLPFEFNEIRRYGFSIRFFKFLLLRFIQNITNYNAEGIIFLTQYAKDKVFKIKNLSHKQTIIIPHGVNKKFLFNPVNKIYRDNADFNNKACMILYVSSIEVYKHQWIVIDAINKLINDGFNIKLTLVGPSGSGSKKLNKSLKTTNSNFVSYLGTASYLDIEKLYLNADIGVFASSCETFGMILTESMSSGLPLAASHMSAIPDVLGNAGLYFDPLDSTDIANKLKVLISSRQLRKELALKGFEQVQKFSWESSSNQSFNFFHNILISYNKHKYAKK